MSDLSLRIRFYANDPMWDAHAEVPKRVLNEAADRIEELELLLRKITIQIAIASEREE